MALNVFLCSTFQDLEAHRSKVISGLRKMHGVEVVAMEDWTAHPDQPRDLCLERVRESDVFVAIVGHLHGFVPEGDDRSITQSEYEEAIGNGKPVLAFLAHDEFRVPPKLIRADPHLDLQDALREEILSAHVVDLGWNSPEELATRVVAAVSDERQRQALVSADRSGPGTGGGGSPDVAALPPSVEAPEIRTYRRRVESLHESLPLAGFPTKLRVPIRLEDLFVPLRAMAHLESGDKASFADAAEAEKKLARDTDSLEIPATEAFATAQARGQRGLVLLGDPGSGKTTQLRRVLLWVLRKGAESLGLPPGMVPVFLPLRQLRDLDSGVDSFIEEQLDHPHLRMTAGFGERLLDRGNLLFLLDGLDEVADAHQRWKVTQWINDAAAANADCRFVVSSRFAGYGVDATDEVGDGHEIRLSEQFLELHLRPLTPDQSEAFVRNWYRIVERGARADPKQADEIARDRARELIERLREPDFRARRVSELTSNPLLLTNLCLVHRDRGQLPRRRADLYGECVDILLESWRAGQGLEAPVTAKDGRRVLQPAAYWLHSEEERTRATAEELAPVIEPALEAIRWKGGAAETFLARIRDESGLLTGWDQKHYGFMHLGFQEYLAAREIRRRAFKEPEVLRELALHHGESWWQEVALLLVALEEPSLFEPYLTEVLDQAAAADEPAALDALLEDAAEVSRVPFLELARREPGSDRTLWARQLLALRVLEDLGSGELEGLKSRLADHPSKEVRSWLGEQQAAAKLELGVSERGEVELVRVPAGSFFMGSPENEEGRYDDEGPQRGVTLPSFEIGRYPVTNEEYGRFLQAHPDAAEPEYWSDRSLNQARQPVVGVSWDDARRFAAWAGCRLPSEAEWEYAARGGTTAPYLEGASEEHLDRFAWYEKNSGGRLHPVGGKEPNAWGLHDVLGNVWEWVEDDWHSTYKGAPGDGSAWVDDPRGDARVLRGGSLYNAPRELRVAYRYNDDPVYRHHGGFRVVRSRSGGQE